MRKVMIGLAVAVAALASAGALAARPGKTAEPQVQVMVLGVYHFDNPGLDLRNIAAEDPLSARRQHELAALADALLRFRPTRVMVEQEVPGPLFDVPGYRDFTPEKLKTQRNEVVQIGYRVAHRAGLANVQGIDEQGGVGKPDYFPFDKVQAWAKANGREPQLGQMFALIDADLKLFNEAQKTETIPALLLRDNTAERIAYSHSFYSGLMSFGDAKEQPGADLNAFWYMRNARIFAKLTQVVRPGDRVLVIYGSGHGYWLRQMAATTPGFASVDVVPYLKDADRRARTAR